MGKEGGRVWPRPGGVKTCVMFAELVGLSAAWEWALEPKSSPCSGLGPSIPRWCFSHLRMGWGAPVVVSSTLPPTPSDAHFSTSGSLAKSQDVYTHTS